MADWRMMGSAMRRRMGAPSNHGAGAREFIHYPEDNPGPGRPVEPEPSIWDRAKAAGMESGEQSASALLAQERDWARRPSPNHPSALKQKRMKPAGQYFG